MLELFEARLPALAAEFEAGRAGLGEGVALYHMVLEGIIFDAAHHALREDLADDALPGVREGTRQRRPKPMCQRSSSSTRRTESQPSRDLLDDLLARAEEAASVWGDAVPDATREYIADVCHRRLAVVGLIEPHVAA